MAIPHANSAVLRGGPNGISHKWLAGACVGWLILVSGVWADDQQLSPEALKAVKKSTVYLRVALGQNRILQGSGFFAGEPGLVLTNAHVLGIHKESSQFPQRIDVVVNSGQKDEQTYLADIIGLDVDLDLAMLRVIGNHLPPPLKVVSAGDVTETQTVFIVGFPLGRSLGKQITVSKSSVSSLRQNEAGVLEHIQVNGGMHHGNSGGPLVDAKGQVVGMSVALVRNTQIDLAISGNRILEFLRGRIAMVSVGKPRQRGKEIVATVHLHVVDPLKQIRSISLDYWLGARGASRPSTSTQPPPVKGDTARKSLDLRLEDDIAEGKWTIPVPGKRQVIWVQPRYVTKSGEKRWAEATIVRPAPPEEEASTASSDGKSPVDDAKRAAAAQKDLKALTGNWKLVRREVQGVLEDIDDQKLGLVIEDGKMTWTKSDRETGLKASIDLDPTAHPPAIDIEFIGVRQFGKQCLGIYELKGDKLILCWNKGDDKRPKKFTTRLAIGCGTVHETYKRIPD